MFEDEFQTKNRLGQLSVQGEHAGKSQIELDGENDILDLISLGAPLPYIFNKLCAAIDTQIGSVVSVILLADDAVHDLESNAACAEQCGLHIFWSAAIALRHDNLLGYFEMYSCDWRNPTETELQLIQRVMQLAILAIRRRDGNEDFDSIGGRWNSALRRRSPAGQQVN